MTIDFQKELIHHLLTNNDFKGYIKDLDPDVFDLSEYKFILSALKEYIKKYGSIPSLTNFLQYLEDEVNGATDLGAITLIITDLYEMDIDDSPIFRAKIIENIKSRKLKNLLRENIGGDASDTKISSMLAELKRIEGIGKVDEDKEPAIITINNLVLPDRSKTKVYPTCISGLNDLTTKGGFAPPELITFLSGPKAFKTGLMINITKGYVTDGLTIFYADFENGSGDILTRFQQNLAHATYGEMMRGECDHILIQQMQKIKKLGGELIIQSYQSDVHSLDDVKNDILALRAQGIYVDGIVYDYLDLARCSDGRIREDTLKLQHIYRQAISINKELGTFALTPSQTTRAAVAKEYLDVKDFSRDYGKAMNVHAAFAIMRTEEEMDASIARLGVVVQRMGSKPTKNKERQVYIQIDEPTMQIREINNPHLTNSNSKPADVKDLFKELY